MSYLESIENFAQEEVENKSDTSSMFNQLPVIPEVFFRDWLKPRLSDEQLKAVQSIFKNDDRGLQWSERYNEYLLLWGEGGGKDFLCSRTLVYCAYWLMCLKNPQKYFNLAPGEPIDLINVSLSGRHAKTVFFYKFKTALRSVINPTTGKNWFKEQGTDLRDRKDVQTVSVEFPKSIRAHSLNSQTYGGEGLNVLLAIFDEVAEFRVEDAKKLYEALTSTATSRYGDDLFKIFLISYMRHENDFMMYRWEKSKNDPKAYRSCKATWEVNPTKKKSDFARAYEKNPEDSARRYENKDLKQNLNKFFKYPDRISNYVNKRRKRPFLDNVMYIEDLNSLTLADYFKPQTIEELYKLQQKNQDKLTDEEATRKIKLEHQHGHAVYNIHIDLAKANVENNNDCAGIAMAHKFLYNPYAAEEGDALHGVYVDFMLQLRSKTELNFESIRKFIYKLSDLGFNINKVTLDGWNSVDFSQLLRQKSIETEILSVDRSREPYVTLKSLLYTNKLDYYEYSIFLRELHDLEDINGKIDHPKVSRARAIDEGTDRGSKDVADAVAGAVYGALSNTNNSNSIWLPAF